MPNGDKKAISRKPRFEEQAISHESKFAGVAANCGENAIGKLGRKMRMAAFIWSPVRGYFVKEEKR